MEIKTGTASSGSGNTSGSITFSRTPVAVLIMVRYGSINNMYGCATLVIEQGYNLSETFYYETSNSNYDYIVISSLMGTTLSFRKHYNTYLRYTALAFVQ